MKLPREENKIQSNSAHLSPQQTDIKSSARKNKALLNNSMSKLAELGEKLQMFDDTRVATKAIKTLDESLDDIEYQATVDQDISNRKKYDQKIEETFNKIVDSLPSHLQEKFKAEHGIAVMRKKIAIRHKMMQKQVADLELEKKEILKNKQYQFAQGNDIAFDEMAIWLKYSYAPLVGMSEREVKEFLDESKQSFIEARIDYEIKLGDEENVRKRIENNEYGLKDKTKLEEYKMAAEKYWQAKRDLKEVQKNIQAYDNGKKVLSELQNYNEVVKNLQGRLKEMTTFQEKYLARMGDVDTSYIKEREKMQKKITEFLATYKPKYTITDLERMYKLGQINRADYIVGSQMIKDGILNGEDEYDVVHAFLWKMTNPSAIKEYKKLKDKDKLIWINNYTEEAAYLYKNGIMSADTYFTINNMKLELMNKLAYDDEFAESYWSYAKQTKRYPNGLTFFIQSTFKNGFNPLAGVKETFLYLRDRSFRKRSERITRKMTRKSLSHAALGYTSLERQAMYLEQEGKSPFRFFETKAGKKNYRVNKAGIIEEIK